MDEPAPPSSVRANLASQRLPGLDILRGIAALCVLYFHTMEFVGSSHSDNGKGYLAVDFFFMLSGYVIARTYEARLNAGYGTGRLIVARYRRLWPIMAIGSLIAAPMAALEIGHPGTWAAVTLANLFLVPILTASILYPLNSAAWSILAELVANLIHAAWLRRLPTRQLALVPLALLPLLAAVGMQFGNLNIGASMATAHGGIIRAVFAYSIGIVLWRWWRDEPTLRIPPFAAFLAMPVLMLAAQIGQARGWMVDLAFIVIACPLLIAGGLAWRRETRTAWWLGAVSFPLYAVHSALLHWSDGLDLGPLPGIACALALAAYIARRMNPPPRQSSAMAIA